MTTDPSTERLLKPVRPSVDADAANRHADPAPGPSSSRSHLLSPSMIVNLKRTFGKTSRNNHENGLGEWDDIIRHASHPFEQPSATTAYKQHNKPVPVTGSDFFSPDHGIVAEPAAIGFDFPSSKNGQRAISGGDEYDSDDSHSGDEYAHIKAARIRRRRSLTHVISPPSKSRTLLGRLWWPDSPIQLTAVQRNVLKCSVAYFLSSLFTFLPFLSDWIAAPFDLEGPISGAHVIATVSCYYNPAKTLGAMIEADIFMLWASFYAFVTCMGSMGTAVWLNYAGFHELSHFVTIIVWLTVSMSLLGWMKVKMNHPQFGSACSMVALIISSVVCKEGSIHAGEFQMTTISSTFTVVFLGALISNVVCFLVWQGSATSKLQGDINKTLESFSTLIDLLCSSFLNVDSYGKITEEALKKATDAHRTSFVALQTSLSAAKLELWDFRIQRTQVSYDRAVASMNRLAQHLTGLRTAVTMERELETQRGLAKQAQHGHLGEGPPTPSHILDTFQAEVGPSLRHLTLTLRGALRDIRTVFARSRAGAAVHGNDLEASIDSEMLPGLADMKLKLQQTIAAYKFAHTKANKQLYRNNPTSLSGEHSAVEYLGRPLLDSRPNDEIFIIYFFCFNLEEFASEMAVLLEAFDAIRQEEQQIEKDHSYYVARFGDFANVVQSLDVFSLWADGTAKHTQTHRLKTLRHKLVQLMPFSLQRKDSPFPPVNDAAVTSHSAAEERQRGLLGRIRRRIWKLGHALKSTQIIYAIKTGIGCGMIGAFAFAHSTRPIFVRYSGNWAMLSYMVVVSTTIGATNFNAFWRIAGTITGAAVATLAWYVLGRGHPVFLCAFSSLFSILPYYIIVTKPKFATSGRFVLLSYNLTALYAYNVRHTGYDIEDIAIHRTLAVTAGTVWGLVVTRFVFPFEARKEFRAGLSELLLEVSFYYQQLTRYIQSGTIEDHALSQKRPSSGVHRVSSKGPENSPLLPTRDQYADVAKNFVDMEMSLQISLIQLGSLLEFSRHEPRLKGPFPTGPYSTVLQAAQRLLDTLHSMRTISGRPDFQRIVRSQFILPTSGERRELAGNILLYLSLLASALSLKGPLPPYLPPAEDARRRLILHIEHLPIVSQSAYRGTSALLLHHSFSLMEQDCVVQLERIGDMFQYLFGVLGDTRGEGEGVRAFDALFESEHDNGRQSPLRSSAASNASSDTESDAR